MLPPLALALGLVLDDAALNWMMSLPQAFAANMNPLLVMRARALLHDALTQVVCDT